MKIRTTSRVCSASLALSLAAALTPVAVQAVPAIWFIGSGNYSNDLKWGVPIVPCNVGSTFFQVTIPDNSGTISDDVPICDVDTFFLGDNSILRILPDNSYTVLGQADLYGIVRGVGGDFTTLTAVFPGNRVRAYSELGSIVSIGAPGYSSIGGWSQ